MKRNAFVVILLFAVAIIWGCSQLAPNEPTATSEGTASISASLSVQEGVMSTAAIDKIQIKVYGSSIDTINKETAFEGAGTTVSLIVPAGKSLVIEVTAFKGTTVVLHGSSNFTAEKDKTTPIALKMSYMLASLVLTPPNSSYNQADNFDVYVAARNVTNLATIGAQVRFDTSAFKVVDITRIDDFLESNTGTIFPLKFSKDNTKGQVDIQLALFPSSAAVSGQGDICKIIFQPKKTGNAEISLNLDNTENSNWGLFDNAATLISSLGLGSKVVIN